LSHKDIKLEMNGYKSFVDVIKKNKLKIGPLVGACFAGAPGIWALGYGEEYTFNLERGRTAQVKKEVTTKLRKKPFAEAKVLTTLKKETEVQVVKEKDGWCLIEISGWETGWCQTRFLTQR
jgi:hypothetical protein